MYGPPEKYFSYQMKSFVGLDLCTNAPCVDEGVFVVDIQRISTYIAMNEYVFVFAQSLGHWGKTKCSMTRWHKRAFASR
jgi:hypothetical protein